MGTTNHAERIPLPSPPYLKSFSAEMVNLEGCRNSPSNPTSHSGHARHTLLFMLHSLCFLSHFPHTYFWSLIMHIPSLYINAHPYLYLEHLPSTLTGNGCGRAWTTSFQSPFKPMGWFSTELARYASLCPLLKEPSDPDVRPSLSAFGLVLFFSPHISSFADKRLYGALGRSSKHLNLPLEPSSQRPTLAAKWDTRFVS